MILLDTSAWVEFLRDTGSPVCGRVEALLSGDIATCDPVRMEVLAGARSEAHLTDLRGLLARATILPTRAGHYEQAALIYRTARSRGLTVRRLMDCVVAAVAIGVQIPLLHADRDFDSIAEVTALRIDSP